MLEEDLGTEGVDYFGQGLTEQLFDTPGAIARIWRSKAYRRSMVVSAEGSRDPNGRPLAFHWRLLQGDPGAGDDRAARRRSRARGSRSTGTTPFRISEDNPLISSRVDIGVFADNGAHDSAPAILSWYFPPETRDLRARPRRRRCASLPSTMPIRQGRGLRRPDADPARRLARRIRLRRRRRARRLDPPPRRQRREAFTADGRRILEPGAAGRPPRTAAVAYALERDPPAGSRCARSTRGLLEPRIAHHAVMDIGIRRAPGLYIVPPFEERR